ncbi:hypothetical protein [Helicobacter trogontum]|uniref:Uncharacterized protein n=1 Tax=Helicobacter trogontum TaxID=50960 RepID=A0A4U8SDP1_9HELI|nr:hypothetical protein [Helicobacter trogontum]TLD84263.1 hypothetical protein LS81_002010 [Helicobacter trogontum]
MFRDGNNKAMGFVIQGYSDTINTQQNNGIGNALRNFNQSLDNSIANYHNAEQAKLNRASTKEQIQTQKHNNAFLQATHNDRVKQVGQQTALNDLDIAYQGRTLDDRVGQQKEQRRAMQLGNNYQERLNLEQQQTSNSRVRSQNAANNANAQHHENDYAQYQTQPVYGEENAYYILEGEKRIPITNQQAQQRMRHNQQVAHNKHVDGFQHVVQNEVNIAVNTNERDRQHKINSINDENADYLTSQGETSASMQRKILEAQHNKEDTVTTKNGEIIPIGYANILANGYYPMSPVGYSAGISINNEDRKTDTQYSQEMMGILRDENATPEKKEAARAYFLSKHKEEAKNMSKDFGSAAHISNTLQKLAGENAPDRTDKALGFLTQYFDTDFSRIYGNLSSAQKDALVTLATQSMSGALSNKDMVIAKGLIPSMWKSNAYNMGIALQAVEKTISKLNRYPDTYGSNVLTPEHTKILKGLYDFRDILMGKQIGLNL